MDSRSFLSTKLKSVRYYLYKSNVSSAIFNFLELQSFNSKTGPTTATNSAKRLISIIAF